MLEVNELHVVVLMPVNNPENKAHYYRNGLRVRELARQTGLTRMMLPPWKEPCEHVLVVKCELCGGSGWTGHRAQHMMAEAIYHDVDFTKWCFICLARFNAMPNTDLAILEF